MDDSRAFMDEKRSQTLDKPSYCPTDKFTEPMKAIAKIINSYETGAPYLPALRSCSDCKLRRQCPYVDAFCKLMFEINDDFAFSVMPQSVLAEECKYFIEREPKE